MHTYARAFEKQDASMSGDLVADPGVKRLAIFSWFLFRGSKYAEGGGGVGQLPFEPLWPLIV